jgi:hypothetical protein
VTIVALRDIPAGEELFYDYGLVIDGRVTKTLRRQYQCLCGSSTCRGTMLALPEKKKKKSGDDKAAKGAGKDKAKAKTKGGKKDKHKKKKQLEQAA